MNAPTIIGTCACGARLVQQRKWRAMTREERHPLQRAGVAGHVARRLCERCYVAHRASGTLIDVPRRTLTQEEVVDAWHNDDHSPGDSDALRIRRLAPRIGMTIKGLEKAIQRAKRSGALSRFPSNTWENRATSEDGPGPAASTAGGSQGLARRYEGAPN